MLTYVAYSFKLGSISRAIRIVRVTVEVRRMTMQLECRALSLTLDA